MTGRGPPVRDGKMRPSEDFPPLATGKKSRFGAGVSLEGGRWGGRAGLEPFQAGNQAFPVSYMTSSMEEGSLLEPDFPRKLCRQVFGGQTDRTRGRVWYCSGDPLLNTFGVSLPSPEPRRRVSRPSLAVGPFFPPLPSPSPFPCLPTPQRHDGPPHERIPTCETHAVSDCPGALA